VNCHDASRLIDAYVDGELAAADASSIETHLETCAACDRLASDRRALSRLIRRVPYYEAPPDLRAAVVARATHPRFPMRALAMAAMLLLAVSLGGITAVRTWRDYRVSHAITHTVFESHVRALREQHLIDVRSSDQHTVKPWFLGKLDFTPPVDDLAADGFPLAGGRVEQIDGRTVAVLIYERRLHPIAVYIWPVEDMPAAASGLESVRGFHVRHWTARGMSCWAVSDLNERELEEFATRFISATTG
jgi:anti-sigma factor (TIGR02949 family)